MRRIKQRLQQRIEYEHEKAKYARQHSHEEGPMAAFQRLWVTPGAAVITKQGPKVALLSPLQDKEPPLRGGVHLRTVAIVEPAKGKRGTSAGWLVSAADVGDDGSEKPRLHAVGKVPTVAAMGSRAPKGAATKHTEQSAHLWWSERRFLTRDLDLKSPTYKVSRWSREPPVHSQTVPDSSPER